MLVLRHRKLCSLHLLPECFLSQLKGIIFQTGLYLTDEAQTNILNIPLKAKVHGQIILKSGFENPSHCPINTYTCHIHF